MSGIPGDSGWAEENNLVNLIEYVIKTEQWPTFNDSAFHHIPNLLWSFRKRAD